MWYNAASAGCTCGNVGRVHWDTSLLKPNHSLPKPGTLLSLVRSPGSKGSVCGLMIHLNKNHGTAYSASSAPSIQHVM